jgi:beta-glucosidase-like glycosyl hydrolase
MSVRKNKNVREISEEYAAMYPTATRRLLRRLIILEFRVKGLEINERTLDRHLRRAFRYKYSLIPEEIVKLNKAENRLKEAKFASQILEEEIKRLEEEQDKAQSDFAKPIASEIAKLLEKIH